MIVRRQLRRISTKHNRRGEEDVFPVSMRAALRMVLKVKRPTPIQREAIPRATSLGENLLCSAETGTGKTLCYLVPIISKLMKGKQKVRPNRPQAMILVHSFPLARQVASLANRLGKLTNVRAVSAARGEKIKPQIEKLRKGVDIVVGTPGGILNLKERGEFIDSDIRICAVDEADVTFDKTSDMGEETRKLLRVVCDIAPNEEFARNDGRFKHRHSRRGGDAAQLIMTGATMQRENADYLKDLVPNLKICTTEAAVPENIEYEHFWATSKDMLDSKSKPAMLLNFLSKWQNEKNDTSSQMLIFCNTFRSCSFLSTFLRDQLSSQKNDKEDGLKLRYTSLHGGQDPKTRERNLKRFDRNECSILLCTDVAMRGLDYPNVTDVVMFDFPYDATTYIHRVGRTARAGTKGKVTSFLTNKDKGLFRQVQDRGNFNGTLYKASGRNKGRSDSGNVRKGRRRKKYDDAFREN